MRLRLSWVRPARRRHPTAVVPHNAWTSLGPSKPGSVSCASSTWTAAAKETTPSANLSGAAGPPLSASSSSSSSSGPPGAAPGQVSPQFRSSHKCIEMDATGRLRVGWMSVRRLRETTGAPLRDLLQLGLSGPRREAGGVTYPPCVLPRDRATLVHFGGLKAVIGTRKAIFFDADLVGVRRAVRRIADALTGGGATSTNNNNNNKNANGSPTTTTISGGAGSMPQLATPRDGVAPGAEEASGASARNAAHTAQTEAVAAAAAAQRTPKTTSQGSSAETEEEKLPFEMGVLEGVLRETASSYSRRRRLYEPVVRASAADGLTVTSEEGFIEDLHTLSSLEGALSGFEAETRAAIAVLVDLLASDEDMVGLLVSERERERTEPSYKIDVAKRHAVVEVLLESYHRRLVHVAASVADLRARLASSRDLARVAIDLRRNKIIRFNLYLSITSVGIASTTAVGGLFGMNLLTGLEDAPHAFTYVALSSAGLGAFVSLGSAILLDRWYSTVDLQRAARDRRAVSNILRDVASLETLVFGGVPSSGWYARLIPPPLSGLSSSVAAGPPHRDSRTPRDETSAASSRQQDHQQHPQHLTRELDLVFQIFDTPKNHDRVDLERAAKALSEDPFSS